MAKARMLHKKICTSEDVNKLPVQARLLFSWLITAADDDGRLKGDPPFVKVEVVPYTNWSPKLISTYLNQMKDIGLIYYWQQNGRWYIEFPKWKEHQYIAKDRYHPSLLPSYSELNKPLYTTRIQPVYKLDTQSNISKSNVIEVNKSEYKENVAVKNIKTNVLTSPIATKSNKMQQIGDILGIPTKDHKRPQFDENQQIVTKDNKRSQNEENLRKHTITNKNIQIDEHRQIPTNTDKNEELEDPNQYRLKSGSEYGAKIAWQKLEPNNPRAFYTTYLSAANKGLPPGLFWQFASEIEQSKTIKPGAVFNSKVKSYFETHTLQNNK